jgi:hypothetical protein
MAGDARGSSHCRKTRVGAAPGAHASRLVAIDGLMASASNFPVFESVGGTQTALACQCFRILGPRREFSILRRLRRVAQAMAPKIGPQNKIIPSVNAHVTPSWKVANKMKAKNPHPRIARSAKPTLVEVVKGCFPKLRQNRASFWTVSGNTTLRCRASISCSHWSRLR